VRALVDKGTATADRVKAGSVGTFWSRLNAVDFMNSAFVLAVFFMISLFPFLAVLDAAVGGDIRRTIITRMGLNGQAAKDVDGLISSGHQALATLSVLGAVFLLLGAIGIAATLQAWYLRVYDQPAPHGAVKQFVYRLLWVAGLLVYISLEVLVGRQVGPTGGHVLIFVCEFAIAVLFWWWTVHFLLLGKIGWRALFPTALATGFCLTGLGVSLRSSSRGRSPRASRAMGPSAS
jgi:membrane protein